MVKTHLPAHMDSVRQTLRPKHQLLILKCYPRLPKNSAADVKPNGSELSYLVYYASTRKSKLQKVGSFLERKTALDVSHFQSVRVHVTLQILTALLENKAVGAGSGFALIAPYVLRIIRDLLNSTTDISLIEASLETWESFCNHQDEATLKADHEYRELFESVVTLYAAFAHRNGRKRLGKSAQSLAVQDVIRLREAGLGATRSLLGSDSLTSESGRQLNVVVPAILSNMHGEDDAYLTNLVRLGKKSEDEEKERALARRVSMATTRTFAEESIDADPRQAEGTAQDADAFAEEEVAILALECLRNVFSSDNRAMIRAGTMEVLKYLSTTKTPPSEKSKPAASATSWASRLFEICTSWTPVQDRFIVMVSLVESLVRLPLREEDLDQHLLYSNLIDHILYSDLNIIGLSAMDVLLSLVQQILRVLQLNASRLGVHSGRNGEDVSQPPQSARNSSPDPPSAARLELLRMLKQNIAHLGTHVYYTDQITDMLSAILVRLKPNPAPTGMQNPVITAAAIEEPRAAAGEVASNISVSGRERPNSSAANGFFSFETARLAALEAVRDILRVSNTTRLQATGGVSSSRSKVPVTIWEGTQWLLRDPSPAVRKAYVDALTTWLRLETSKADMRVKQPKDKAKKKPENAFAKRAMSNASNKKDKQSKKATTTFLQLLHLAVFENALQYASMETVEAERELLMLHYLLATLVQRLGVNALQSGLPMVFALQDEGAKSESMAVKVSTGSLVYGYLWVLAEAYDFDVSSVGQEIFGEIKRRKQNKLWVENISMPARGLEDIAASSRESTSLPEQSGDGMKPFELRGELIERIADCYATTVASPSPSAPGSPGRTPGQRRLSASAGPALDRTASSYLTVKPQADSSLPEKVKEAMMATWTREGCMSDIAAAAPKSISLSGYSSPSQALAAGNHRQLLAAAANTMSSRNPSPLPSAQRFVAHQTPQAGQQVLGAHLMSESPARRQSVSSNGKLSSSAGVHGRIRVEDLKRALAEGTFNSSLTSRLSDRGDEQQDVASESLVDVGGEDLTSENGGFVTPPSRVEGSQAPSLPPVIPDALDLTPKRGNPVEEEPPLLELAVLPVRRPPSRAGASVKSQRGQGRRNLAALLAGIETEELGARKSSRSERPPY